MLLPLPFTAEAISLAYGAVDNEYYFPTSPHQGVDFSSASREVSAGTSIPASGAGRVVRSGVGPIGVSPNISRPNNLSGNSIDVDYGDVVARYMHRPYDSPSPPAGADVDYGTSLGVIGSTGQVSAAHLHMETWDKATGRRVNPAIFFDFSRYVGDGTAANIAARPFPTRMKGSTMHAIRQINVPDSGVIIRDTAAPYSLPDQKFRAVAGGLGIDIIDVADWQYQTVIAEQWAAHIADKAMRGEGANLNAADPKSIADAVRDALKNTTFKVVVS